MIKLGSIVKDSITGFEGMATGRTIHLFGCVHISITPTELKDGKPVEAQLFDEQRVEVLVEGQTAGPDPRLVGSEVKDRVTGFTGIVTSMVKYLSGPELVCVTTKSLHEGKPIEPHWFDADRVQFLNAPEIKVSPQSSATSGGPALTSGKICR